MSRRLLHCFALCGFFALFLASAASRGAATDGDTVSEVDDSQWFRSERTANCAAVVAFSLLVLYFVSRGKRGKMFYIRPIAGLSALEDAVGRAAETGSPVAYVPGLTDISDPATVASMSILSRVAQRAAKLRCRVSVPHYSALTYPVSRSVVRDAFVRAGREAFFDPDDITFFTSRHMTYTMAVVGTMTRQKPAACFLIGHFFSESLILAETGASLGAVQIGATDAVSQLPFFITTCDYTLIGEELFAAGALLGEDLPARSTVAAHDWFKAAAALLIAAAALLWLLDAAGVETAGEWAMRAAHLLQETK